MKLTEPLATHLTDSELDARRAGWDQGDVDDARRIDDHLQQCSHCRARLQQWADVAIALDARDPWLDHALRRRRQAALNGDGVAARPRSWRLTAALAAGLTGVALGLSVMLHAPNNTAPETQAQAPTATEVPDLYADIDFYLWLMRKDQPEDGSNG